MAHSPCLYGTAQLWLSLSRSSEGPAAVETWLRSSGQHPPPCPVPVSLQLQHMRLRAVSNLHVASSICASLWKKSIHVTSCLYCLCVRYSGGFCFLPASCPIIKVSGLVQVNDGNGWRQKGEPGFRTSVNTGVRQEASGGGSHDNSTCQFANRS